jgi:uncharacterized protein (DUF342 family)
MEDYNPIIYDYEDSYDNRYHLFKDYLQELADLYKVPVSYVESKKDDLAKYCEAKGTTYKNYKAALSLWIKNDVKAGKAPVKVVKTYPDDEIRKKYPNF